MASVHRFLRFLTLGSNAAAVFGFLAINGRKRIRNCMMQQQPKLFFASKTQNVYRTVVSPPPLSFAEDKRIRHNDQIVLIGSCFSDSMGEKFASLKYRVDRNPFGIVYNPVSISHSLNRMLDGKVFVEEELGFHDGKYYR